MIPDCCKQAVETIARFEIFCSINAKDRHTTDDLIMTNQKAFERDLPKVEEPTSGHEIRPYISRLRFLLATTRNIHRRLDIV